MQKMLAGLLSTGLFLGTAVPAFAQGQNMVRPPVDRPLKDWKTVQATPGNPVTLEGKGVLKARGRGQVRYHITDGNVVIGGRGVVGVKGNPTVEVVRGFGDKKQIGEWTYYYGKGHLKITGTNYDVVSFGRIKTGARGEGKVTFRGYWTIRYHGFNTVSSHQDALTVPSELKTEAGADSELK